MKRPVFILILVLLAFKVFPADLVTFEVVQKGYEDFLNIQSEEALQDFSELLDVFRSGDFYQSVQKKSAEYKKSFDVLDDAVKQILGNMESPWLSGENNQENSFKASDISGPFSNFLIRHYSYTTRWAFISRAILTGFLIFIFVLLIFLLLYARVKRQRQNALLQAKFILQGQESERRRISGELHDTIAQNLKIQRLQILNTKDYLPKDDFLLARWDELFSSAEQNMTQIRSVCQNLFPPNFEKQKLEWILQDFCKNTELKHNVNCTFFISKESEVDALSSENKLHVFRIIQESVNNAALHGGANNIDIAVTKKMLSVKDDGHGFNVSETLATQTNHFGLRSIYERARILGASCHITSTENGTEMNIQF